FVSLRNYSWFSEGVNSPRELAMRAAQLGQKALALTDKNSLVGAYEFVAACQEAGIKPILGLRVEVGNQHATVLLAEASGWTSLCKILGMVAQGGFRLPHILAQNSAGLHLLVDDPRLFQPPIPDRFADGRLWTEIV